MMTPEAPDRAGTSTAVIVTETQDGAEWDRFVDSRPDGSGYHSWAWRQVFERTFGHRSIYLIARRGTAVEGVLPLVYIKSAIFGRSLTSLPFLNYGGVVADADEVAQRLLDEASRIARGFRCHVELRHVRRRFERLPCKQHKVAMVLPLAAGIWDRLDRKVRNQIRKGEKSGLTVARGGAEFLAEFYAVFARNMRDLGTPVYPRRLFEEVLAAFPDRARILVVRLGEQPIAAGLTFRTRHTIEIPWASSIREHNHLCPNHVLYWHALETAVAEGCVTFDFGRSTPHEGTYKFKEQWGAAPVALHWEYVLRDGDRLPDQSPKNPKFSLAIATWKRLPLWLSNALGPHIVRAIP